MVEALIYRAVDTRYVISSVQPRDSKTVRNLSPHR